MKFHQNDIFSFQNENVNVANETIVIFFNNYDSFKNTFNKKGGFDLRLCFYCIKNINLSVRQAW
ncbi:hypothetical protein ACIAD1046 [Acinetobacter baylyi ADP1]|uniref:Uncharacterized protein n=1 Tax=Acinetobacter baylyi (strain ATCC 33305 / BD413 / ADP1) TaxID=62977 RepID=Q6FDC3_ACIAD|nr:hypothetical protein [Acinetobacter sp.]CAG67935.1 hypothetical protein ACIAD1046 [Acinetobacter baylyi ADP1]